MASLVPRKTSWADIFRGAPVGAFVETPAGIAYRQGKLYICDTGLRTVHVWDLANGKARRLGHTGDTKLLTPVAVAVDEAGSAYVADTGVGEVIVFSADGNLTRHYHPPDREDYKPVAVALRAGELFVADISTHTIDVFDRATGALKTTLGALGSEPGQFYFPMGLAVDDSGDLIVADAFNARVQVLDPQYSVKTIMGQPGDRYGDMGKPRQVDIGPDGTIFIADAEFAHVHLFDRQGRLLMLLGSPDDGPGGTPLPVGVAVAQSLPERLSARVPANFSAQYFVFVSNTIGSKRLGLYAIGTAR